MDDFSIGHEAVAGISEHRIGIWRLAVQQRDDGCRGDLAMLVRHVPGLRHRGRGKRRVTEHVRAGHRRGLHGAPVDVAPAVVGGDQPCLEGDIACAMRRYHVEDIAFDILELELDGHGLVVDIDRFRVAAVFDDSRIELGPGFLEKRPFGGHVGICIDQQHFGPGLGFLEIGGNLASALVRSGRAAIRGKRHREHIYAAVLHRLELLTQ